jgi:hypothetical protein
MIGTWLIMQRAACAQLPRNYSVSSGALIKKCLASKRFLQYGHCEDDPLLKLKSPSRFVIRPIVDYALELEKAYADTRRRRSPRTGTDPGLWAYR